MIIGLLFILTLLSIGLILYRYITISDKNNFFFRNWLYFLPLFIFALLTSLFSIGYIIYALSKNKKRRPISPPSSRRSSAVEKYMVNGSLPNYRSITSSEVQGLSATQNPLRHQSILKQRSPSVITDLRTDPLETGSFFPSDIQIRDRCPSEFIYNSLWNLIREVFLKEGPFYVKNLIEGGGNPPFLISDKENSPYIIAHPWTVPQDVERHPVRLRLYLADVLDQLHYETDWTMMIPIIKTTGVYQKNISSIGNIGETQHILLIVENRRNNIHSYILDPKGTDTQFIIDSINIIFDNSQITQKSCYIQSDIDYADSKYFVIRMMYNYINEGVDLRKNKTLDKICPERSWNSSRIDKSGAKNSLSKQRR